MTVPWTLILAKTPEEGAAFARHRRGEPIGAGAFAFDDGRAVVVAEGSGVLSFARGTRVYLVNGWRERSDARVIETALRRGHFVKML